MIKLFINLMFLASFLAVGGAYAGNPEDVKKLNSFLKKEAPGVPAALDLAHEDMRSYDFTSPKSGGKEFDGANMEGANITSVRFADCDFSGANFKNAKLIFGGFRNSDLSNVNFARAKFESIGFSHVKMTSANFDGAELFRVSMVDVDKEGASLGNATTRDCSGMGWFS